jgi:hypothetical protein
MHKVFFLFICCHILEQKCGMTSCLCVPLSKRDNIFLYGFKQSCHSYTDKNITNTTNLFNIILPLLGQHVSAPT